MEIWKLLALSIYISIYLSVIYLPPYLPMCVHSCIHLLNAYSGYDPVVSILSHLIFTSTQKIDNITPFYG